MSATRVTELNNGLRVATDRMPSVETVSVGVWVDTGSRCEPAAMSGASHFLEHMVFKGTRRRDARAIAEEIESVGGHLNAHTSREYTAFYAKVLKEDTALAIDVISDMLQDATLDHSELKREKTVVLQEIMQSLDTPDDVIFDRFQETAFPDQPLGRPVLGSAPLIDGMSRDRLMGFMQEHYGAPRMVLAAAGNIDHDTLVELAKTAFDRLPLSCDKTREPGIYRGGEWREAKDLEQVNLLIGFQSISFRDENFHALSLLSTLLGGGMSSRLFQEAREKRGLVYSIYSYPAAYADTGIFGVYAGTGANEAEELIPLICEELRKIRHDVGETELARARAQLKSGILMSLESTSARCEQLARQIMVFGRPIPTSETVAKIDAVTPEKVQAVAQRVFAAQPTVAALGPIDKVPEYDTICALLH
ncbi:MAG: insulinase family protein [Hyphomicrobiales bacterium]|nr:insulinase family protein [Hyphomicrobiales bacterium]